MGKFPHIPIFSSVLRTRPAMDPRTFTLHLPVIPLQLHMCHWMHVDPLRWSFLRPQPISWMTTIVIGPICSPFPGPCHTQTKDRQEHSWLQRWQEIPSMSYAIWVDGSWEKSRGLLKSSLRYVQNARMQTVTLSSEPLYAWNPNLTDLGK